MLDIKWFKKTLNIIYQLMKQIVLIILLSLICHSVVKAQIKADTTLNKCYTIDGTYQIQVINSRSQPLMPVNLNKIVLENRDATKVKYVPLGSIVRIMILPLSEINKPDFKREYECIHFSG